MKIENTFFENKVLKTRVIVLLEMILISSVYI